MSLLIQVETVHRTYSEAPESFISKSGDVVEIRVFLKINLKEHPDWVEAICNILPFNHGQDVFLISPGPRQIMNSAYRGKVVKVSTIQ